MSELRTASAERYVIASSAEMACRNRNGALLAFATEAEAWREMAAKQRIYPVNAGFGVFCVNVAARECEPPMTEERHEEVYGLDIDHPANR